MPNTADKRLTVRRELVMSPEEDAMLDAIREARTKHDPVSRNETMRALVREAHRRHTQRTARNAVPKETQ